MARARAPAWYRSAGSEHDDLEARARRRGRATHTIGRCAEAGGLWARVRRRAARAGTCATTDRDQSQRRVSSSHAVQGNKGAASRGRV
jgi:hypothetical protein